ncbi:allene oxide cyclase barrel-like domain-containing protein [Streptomyces cyanogenus]|uniref:Allene oxide cyclase barrel-like domain-containing protein n=1 Tax=Streptomyces cyanogenus TaxID=80860 RepID=A0ABX7TM77_STRCY|nr:hypothetical protein [Streptomyces cyanogenus]QTD96703.1 hypothetical protein S1361_05035 [Streptomyces cyanogenus]
MTTGLEENENAAAQPIDRRAMDVGVEARREVADPSPLDPEALALAAAAAAGVCTPGDGAQARAAAIEKCVVVTGLTEKIEKLVVHDGETPGLGTSVEYTDAFYDADGNRVATVNGRSVVLSTTPHMWQYHQSRAELEDGTFEAVGVLDCTVMMRGGTQLFRITGTGGRYAGKVGYMTLAIADPSQKPPHYATSFVLC